MQQKASKMFRVKTAYTWLIKLTKDGKNNHIGDTKLMEIVGTDKIHKKAVVG